MPHRCHIIICLLFFAIIVSVSTGESGSSDVASSPSASSQPQSKTKQASQEEPSGSHVDFTDLNLSNPESATVSFVQYFNNILPVTTTIDLQMICQKLTISSYQKGCMVLLESRLSFIKSIARNLEGAMFGYQQPTKLSTQPMAIKATWIEKLSFFDGSTKVSDKKMIIYLDKLGDDWKISNIK